MLISNDGLDGGGKTRRAQKNPNWQGTVPRADACCRICECEEKTKRSYASSFFLPNTNSTASASSTIPQAATMKVEMGMLKPGTLIP